MNLEVTMEDREIFVEVVERGSFTAAAERLGISTSYVSRRVRALEADLGAQLIARHTRKMVLTEVGERYFGRIRPLLMALDEADAEVSTQTDEPRGTLRVAAPLTFGLAWVQPVLLAFKRRWPEVVIDVSYSDRKVDPLVWDVTIRAGHLEDSSLVARKLAPFQGVLAASPDYLGRRGTPGHPSELPAHDVITYSGLRTLKPWSFRRGDERVELQVSSTFRADNGDAVVQAGIAGLGILNQPDFLVGEPLARGELVRLLPDWTTIDAAIWAITPSRLQPAKVRHFVSMLSERLAPRPWLSPGSTP